MARAQGGIPSQLQRDRPERIWRRSCLLHGRRQALRNGASLFGQLPRVSSLNRAVSPSWHPAISLGRRCYLLTAHEQCCHPAPCWLGKPSRRSRAGAFRSARRSCRQWRNMVSQACSQPSQARETRCSICHILCRSHGASHCRWAHRQARSRRFYLCSHVRLISRPCNCQNRNGYSRRPRVQ